MLNFPEVCTFMHSLLGWGSFCMNYCMEAISLFITTWCVIEAQVSLMTAAFSSVLLGLVSFILPISHRFSIGFMSSKLAGQSSAIIQWSVTSNLSTVTRCRVMLEKEVSNSIKLSEDRRMIYSKISCQFWLWTLRNTVDMTWLPKSSLIAKMIDRTWSNLDSVPLHSSCRFWDLNFQMKG